MSNLDFEDCKQLALLEAPEQMAICPFKVVADVNEGIPYRFTGIKTDSGKGGRALAVEIVQKPLYAMHREKVTVKDKPYSKGLADYSIDGLEQFVQIERKSLEDLYGTLGGRRDDFEAEIARLDMCQFAAVVIEADWQTILFNPPDYSRLLPKVVSRTVLSWSIRYPRVHWYTCSGRDHAESLTFRLLEMFWRHWQH